MIFHMTMKWWWPTVVRRWKGYWVPIFPGKVFLVTWISAIGWAKAAKIAAVMTEDTAEELLELAETNTVVDLVENIKTSYKEEGGTKGTKQLVKIFKFKLLQDSANAIEEILTAVAAAMSFQSVDQAFEHIVSEWALEHPVGGQSGKTVARAAAKATAAKATAPRAAGRAAARG